MKKTRKALATLAIAGMTLTMVPFNAFATEAVSPRLAGLTAAQTAVEIANETGWKDTAILASSESYGMVDALTAGPLASYLKAPILLTGAGNVLDAATKAELVELDVKKVYVTSGTAVISPGVLADLVTMGITIVPLGGLDRSETSVNIASQMVGVTKVAIANGLQDALSIAAIASAANEPILLTDKETLPDSVATFLTAHPTITSSDVIGGTGIISEDVEALVPSATRHAGITAYDTNKEVIQDFNASLTYDKVYLANGVTGIDALAGAPLAAQTNSPIVLTDGVNAPAAGAFVKGQMTASSVVTALGGTAVVPESQCDLGVPTVTPVVQAAMDSVLKAEKSKSQADVAAAKILVEALPADVAPLTTKATLLARLVAVSAPVINSVNFKSSNTTTGSAVTGDTVTLTFTSDQPITKSGNFKINGSNPNTFTNVGNVYTATHLVDSGDHAGAATFQINVQNAAGVYSQTVEMTTDGSTITVVIP